MKSIVIGSGFGGIAAALRLKAKKYEVTLIEKHNDLGGRASVFKKNGFTFDSGPTVITAFIFYFCFLHSIRHSFSLIVEIDNNNFKNGLTIFLKKALPLTVLTIAIYLISLFYLNNSFEFNDAILKVIFIGLASLTFPHILLEYLLEKNEK